MMRFYPSFLLVFFRRFLLIEHFEVLARQEERVLVFFVSIFGILGLAVCQF